MDIKRLQTDWYGAGDTQRQLDEMLIKQPLPQKIQPYYRSKAFVSQIGVNPLLAAAAPVFFLAEKTQQSPVAPDLTKLREDFGYEIKAFDNQAQTQKYRANIILAARYALCVWIDEIILSTAWGKDSDWKQQPLAENAQFHTTENKSFFIVLNHCLHDLPTYIDLLELFYICLSLGYEGEYRYLERGHLLLDEVKDHLFHNIQRQRGEVSNRLTIKNTEPPQKLPEKILTKALCKIGTLSIVVFSLGVSYFFLANNLNADLNTTQASLQPLIARVRGAAL